jgi:purine-nucleoside phosphorylase
MGIDEIAGHHTGRDIDLGSLVEDTARSVAYLKRRLTIRPKTVVILGSGQGGVADLAGDGPEIMMDKVPGFAAPQVPGHAGVIRAGIVEGEPTLFCEGRLHFYETGDMAETVYPLQTFLALGVERIILTTSAGSLNPDYKVGDVMFVTDHINLMGDNPFIGVDPRQTPSVFVDMDHLYAELSSVDAERIARRSRITPRFGTLAAVAGPIYETPAERNMLKLMGADAVCMSVAPEALAAARVGAPVVALAVIVNPASGKGGGVSHADVVETGAKQVAGLRRLIGGLIASDWR